MKESMKSGFTLIELLVVVAIIAVIGAGVAVTYQKLDDRAKTAMEISDIGTIEKAIKHWSFLHDWALPDRLDSLIDTEGRLYSQMTAQGGMSGVSAGNGVNGLYAQSGYTFVAADAPQRVISNLANAGISAVYLHDPNTTPANDSTFSAGRMAGDVDTSNTAAVLSTSDNNDEKLRAAAIVEANTDATAALTQPDGYDASDESTWGSYTGTYTVNWEDSEGAQSETFNDLGAWNTAYAAAETVNNSSRTVNKLAFISPDGGAMMAGMAMGMNLSSEIISNCGLQPADVARPDEDAATAGANNRKYWLVVFGLGRFTTLYSGKSVRVDMPVVSKRYNSDSSIYSRYLVVVRVPVGSYTGMTGTTEAPQVACVLSPQGLSVSALGDNYRNDVQKTNN